MSGRYLLIVIKTVVYIASLLLTCILVHINSNTSSDTVITSISQGLVNSCEESPKYDLAPTNFVCRFPCPEDLLAWLRQLHGNWTRVNRMVVYFVQKAQICRRISPNLLHNHFPRLRILLVHAHRCPFLQLPESDDLPWLNQLSLLFPLPQPDTPILETTSPKPLSVDRQKSGKIHYQLERLEAARGQCCDLFSGITELPRLRYLTIGCAHVSITSTTQCAREFSLEATGNNISIPANVVPLPERLIIAPQLKHLQALFTGANEQPTCLVHRLRNLTLLHLYTLEDSMHTVLTPKSLFDLPSLTDVIMRFGQHVHLTSQLEDYPRLGSSHVRHLRLQALQGQVLPQMADLWHCHDCTGLSEKDADELYNEEELEPFNPKFEKEEENESRVKENSELLSSQTIVEWIRPGQQVVQIRSFILSSCIWTDRVCRNLTSILPYGNFSLNTTDLFLEDTNVCHLDALGLRRLPQLRQLVISARSCGERLHRFGQLSQAPEPSELLASLPRPWILRRLQFEVAVCSCEDMVRIGLLEKGLPKAIIRVNCRNLKCLTRLPGDLAKMGMHEHEGWNDGEFLIVPGQLRRALAEICDSESVQGRRLVPGSRLDNATNPVDVTLGIRDQMGRMPLASLAGLEECERRLAAIQRSQSAIATYWPHFGLGRVNLLLLSSLQVQLIVWL
ncbi:unnamed protein product [Protopolystoma xenopodis]|uniref:Uncharacterized protein n=1 Tax=Protopolystoma xenopodis TaxID=117903 RepID=A0A3S5B8R5_9PLAT|nr:unnamed protein product [Protopolystoma xenopodis]